MSGLGDLSEDGHGMPFPNLSKAPIIEGLISLHGKVSTDVTLKDLARLTDHIGASYPVHKDLQEIRAEFRVGPSAQSHAAHTVVVGYRYERQSPRFVVQAKVGELLISRLSPYNDWNELFTEAKSLWAVYCEVVKPEIVTRVATRFINRIELPLDGLDFDEYLAAAPVIPKGLPQTFNHFLTRIVVPHEQSGADVAISQALDAPNAQTRKLPLILDIDVYKKVDLPVDSTEVWALLTTMRDVKNQAFFDSVTPKALELFQ